jgi:hypothetical protein
MGELAATLDHLRARVLSGAILELGPLSERLERLVATAGSLTAAEADIVRGKARQNALILVAAMKGVRAAQRRLTDLREAEKGLRTYGPKGERSAVSAGATTLRQRV